MKLVRLSLIFSMVAVLGIFCISSTSNAEAAYDIPDWIKNLAGMWFSGAINDDAFGAALDWLIENEIITTPSSSTSSASDGTFFPVGGNGTHNIIPIGGNGTHILGPIDRASDGTFFPVGGNGTHNIIPIGGNATHIIIPIGGNGTHIIIPIN